MATKKTLISTKRKKTPTKRKKTKILEETSGKHPPRPLSPIDEKNFRAFIEIPRQHEVLSVNHQRVLDLFATLDAVRADLDEKVLLIPRIKGGGKVRKDDGVASKSRLVQVFHYYAAVTGLRNAKPHHSDIVGVGKTMEQALRNAEAKGFVHNKWRFVRVEPITADQLLLIASGEKSWAKVVRK